MKQRKLTCHACAHENADACRKGKHLPSEERPCEFCIRNDKRRDEAAQWYDGSVPVKVPMDCYVPIDMILQLTAWARQQPTILEKVFNPSKR